MVKDSLSIRVKQAPISKVNIYPDHIDIITGFTNESVLRKFEINDKYFLNKYISLPAYINNLLINEIDNTSFILDGAYSIDGYTPNDDEYDTYDFDDYYNNIDQDMNTPKDLEMIEYISNKYVLILSTSTHNLKKEYLLQILEVDRIINNDNEIEADESGAIKLYKPKIRLSVLFQKIDTIYKSRKKYIDYHNIDSTRKFNALINNKTNESVVSINDNIGIIISKYND